MHLQAPHLAPQVMGSNTALIREQASRHPARRSDDRVDRRVGQQQVAARHTGVKKQAAVQRESAVTPDSMRPAQVRSANPWNSRIPNGAIFYDEVADLTAGGDQLGLLVSVRV